MEWLCLHSAKIPALINMVKVSPTRGYVRQPRKECSQEVASSGVICLQPPHVGGIVGREADGQVAESTDHQAYQWVLLMVLVGSGRPRDSIAETGAQIGPDRESGQNSSPGRHQCLSNSPRPGAESALDKC